MAVTKLPEDVTLQEATQQFLDKEKKMLIGGTWVGAASGTTFETHNPATGELLATVPAADKEDIDTAVAAARTAFESGPWAKMSGYDRADILWRVADLINQHADELAEIETLDNGKPLKMSRRVDMNQAAKHFKYYAGWASKIEGSTIPVSFPGNFVYTVREPVGVVGAIIPWNFPLLMSAWKLAPALAAGNTVILKPAEQTPLTALRLGELLIEAGIPEGVVNIVTGYGVPAGSAMADHMGIDKIAFTGSTSVGRKILGASANTNLKRVSLELGGKSPNVVFADADMKSAIRGATWGVFTTAGQECVAGSRLFIERSVFDEVIEGMAEQAQRIRIGNGFTNVHIGPIISPDQLETIHGYVEDERDQVDVVTGGERLGGDLADGNFYAPTIVTHEDDSLTLVQEEIFGPVVAATPFDDWDEVVQRANLTNYGLAAGIWTRDIGKAHRLAHAIKAGTVWINQYGMIDAPAPFGGYKESGHGREMGKDAIDLYTETKTVWVNMG